MTPSVCVLGLGLMGRPIAQRLSGERFAVSAWNRSPVDTRALRLGRPVTLAEAAAADVLLIIVADTAATGEVLAGLEPHLRPGSVVLDMGSSAPGDSRERARRLAQRGVGWVDAPVSGGPQGAAAGRLAVMVGGDEADVARARPVLDALGAQVTHVGGPGAGHAMKVVNQVIVGLGIEAVAEAMALATGLGFDPALVARALSGGSADTPQLRSAGSRMVRRDYAPGAKVRTILKDIRMADALAGELELTLPQIHGARRVWEQLAESGAAEDDCAILFEAQAPGGRLGRPRAP